jgi:hypothetical protein
MRATFASTGAGATAALLGVFALTALACTSSAGATSSGASSGDNTGSAASGSSGGTAPGTSSSGGMGSGGNVSGSSGTTGGTGQGTSGGSTGGTTGGPCIPTGTTACQSMSGPPPGCWLNPQTSDQIMNGCTASPYDQSIPAPPPDGGEDLPEYDGGSFPLPSP